jgi:hypothetical protein
MFLTIVIHMFEPQWRGAAFPALHPSGEQWAYTDRYALKAEHYDDEHYCYLCEEFGEDSPEARQFAEEHDEWYYMNPLTHGPYMRDQPDNGWFRVQGPAFPPLQGPRQDNRDRPVEEWDRSLYQKSDVGATAPTYAA